MYNDFIVDLTKLVNKKKKIKKNIHEILIVHRIALSYSLKLNVRIIKYIQVASS